MSKYTIQTIKKKDTPALADVVVTDEEGVNHTATIWKTDKKTQEVFPGYDSLAPGSVIEGNLWSNPTSGAKTIYPPKKGNLGPKPKWLGNANAEKLMDKKAENIDHSQDRKEYGIMISSTMDKAVSTVIALMGDKPLTPTLYKESVLLWRQWFIKNWETINGDDKTLTSDGKDLPF